MMSLSFRKFFKISHHLVNAPLSCTPSPFMSNTIQVCMSTSINQNQQPLKVNVLNLKLTPDLRNIFENTKDNLKDVPKQQISAIQKFLVVKRKSMITGGRIPELKGIQVENILRESREEFLKNFSSNSVNELIDLLMLDSSSLKNSQRQLIQYISCHKSTLTQSQVLFLLKSALFCTTDIQSKGELDSLVAAFFAKNSHEIAQFPTFDLILLLVIYYQRLSAEPLKREFNNTPTRTVLVEREQTFRKKNGIAFIESQEDSKLFYEIVGEFILTRQNSVSKNETAEFVYLLKELLYIGIQSDSILLNNILERIQGKNLTLSELVGVVSIANYKNIVLPEGLYSEFIQRVEQASKNSYSINNRNRNSVAVVQDIPNASEFREHLLGLDIGGIEFTEDNSNQQFEQKSEMLSLDAAVNVLSVVIRNYESSQNALHERLLKRMNESLDRLQIRHLLLVLSSFSGYQMNRNTWFIGIPAADGDVSMRNGVFNAASGENAVEFKSFSQLFNVKEALRLLMSRIKVSSQRLAAKQACALYLNLSYFVASNQASWKDDVDVQIQSGLRNSYERLTLRRNVVSKTEEQFLFAIRGLQQRNLIQTKEEVKSGVLIENLYYVDLLFAGKKVLEINGDQHLNRQTGGVVRHNFLQKLFILKFLGYSTSVVHAADYLKVIQSRSKFESLIIQHANILNL